MPTQLSRAQVLLSRVPLALPTRSLASLARVLALSPLTALAVAVSFAESTFVSQSPLTYTQQTQPTN